MTLLCMRNRPIVKLNRIYSYWYCCIYFNFSIELVISSRGLSCFNYRPSEGKCLHLRPVGRTSLRNFSSAIRFYFLAAAFCSYFDWTFNHILFQGSTNP